jgi:hypothetical protein
MTTTQSDITSGTARVPFAPACKPMGRDHLEAGWVLPGGERTAVPERAQIVAENIDRMFDRMFDRPVIKYHWRDCP